MMRSLFVGSVFLFSILIPAAHAEGNLSPSEEKALSIWISGGTTQQKATTSETGFRGTAGFDISFGDLRRSTLGYLMSMSSVNEYSQDIYRAKVRRLNSITFFGYEFIPRALELRGGLGFSANWTTGPNSTGGGFDQMLEANYFFARTKQGLRLTLTFLNSLVMYQITQHPDLFNPVDVKVPNMSAVTAALAYHF